MARTPITAVLLDAFGTLLALDPPAPALRERLARDGHRHAEEDVAAAVAEEVLYYRAHHDRGRDAASLAALRRDCAGVIARRLGGDTPPPCRLAEHLVASLRFRLMPDARPALDELRDAGVRLAVVSNWDCSLPQVLAGLGVADRFDAVSVSAVVGAAKPDARIFRHALDRLGVAPGEALHCGDRARYDCAGARAAGLRAVLVDRSGAAGATPAPRPAESAGAERDCPRIPSLAALPALVR